MHSSFFIFYFFFGVDIFDLSTFAARTKNIIEMTDMNLIESRLEAAAIIDTFLIDTSKREVGLNVKILNLVSMVKAGIR